MKQHSLLEASTGNEDEGEIDGKNSLCSSFDIGEKDMNYLGLELLSLALVTKIKSADSLLV
jgi:hypothetical protein